MKSVHPAVISRASGAFSSLAVSVALAALTILALAFGTVQNSKAESGPDAASAGPQQQAKSHPQEFR